MGLLDAVVDRREGPGSGATEVGELRLRPLSDYKTERQNLYSSRDLPSRDIINFLSIQF